MSESASVGYVLGQLLATDGDSGPDAEFEFLLVADSNNKGFSLDRQSGQLVVAAELDRESVETITLTALVKNPGPVRGRWCFKSEKKSACISLSILATLIPFSLFYTGHIYREKMMTA